MARPSGPAIRKGVNPMTNEAIRKETKNPLMMKDDPDDAWEAIVWKNPSEADPTG
jgi:hypothetical protein